MKFIAINNETSQLTFALAHQARRAIDFALMLDEESLTLLYDFFDERKLRLYEACLANLKDSMIKVKNEKEFDPSKRRRLLNILSRLNSRRHGTIYLLPEELTFVINSLETFKTTITSRGTSGIHYTRRQNLDQVMGLLTLRTHASVQITRSRKIETLSQSITIYTELLPIEKLFERGEGV